MNDFLRMSWVYFMPSKSDMPATFKRFFADLRAEGAPSDIECLRTDNGTGFISREFVALLDHYGIRRDLTPVNTPNMNGIVERRLGLVQEATMAACLEVERRFPGMPLPPTGRL